MNSIEHFIDGKIAKGSSKKTSKVFNPATGEQTSEVILASKIDIDHKLQQIDNRRKTLFTSTISDERWEELQYNKKNISDYTNAWSFANVIGNLWLKRDLPAYGIEFINTILIFS